MLGLLIALLACEATDDDTDTGSGESDTDSVDSSDSQPDSSDSTETSDTSEDTSDTSDTADTSDTSDTEPDFDVWYGSCAQAELGAPIQAGLHFLPLGPLGESGLAECLPAGIGDAFAVVTVPPGELLTVDASILGGVEAVALQRFCEEADCLARSVSQAGEPAILQWANTSDLAIDRIVHVRAIEGATDAFVDLRLSALTPLESEYCGSSELPNGDYVVTFSGSDARPATCSSGDPTPAAEQWANFQRTGVRLAFTVQDDANGVRPYLLFEAGCEPGGCGPGLEGAGTLWANGLDNGSLRIDAFSATPGPMRLSVRDYPLSPANTSPTCADAAAASTVAFGALTLNPGAHPNATGAAGGACGTGSLNGPEAWLRVDVPAGHALLAEVRTPDAVWMSLHDPACDADACLVGGDFVSVDMGQPIPTLAWRNETEAPVTRILRFDHFSPSANPGTIQVDLRVAPW